MSPTPDPRPNRCINIIVNYDLPLGAERPEESIWGTEPHELFPGIISETMVKPWESVELHFERPFPECFGKAIHRIRAAQVDERERAQTLRQRRKRQDE